METKNFINDKIFSKFELKDKNFIKSQNGNITFHDFFLLANRISNLFSCLGLKAGDRILVQVEKSPFALAVYAASIRSGYVYIPLNINYTVHEIDYFIENSKPSLFILDPKYQNKIGQKLKIKNIQHLTLDIDQKGTLSELSYEQQSSFNIVPRGPNDLAAILYTSGTTGVSKGAMINHKNLVSNTEILSNYWLFQKTDVLLHALPIFHIHGLFVACNICFYSGAEMIFLQKFDLSKVIDNLPNASVMMGVPTFYTRLLEDPKFNKFVAKNIRLFISGSAPLLEETHNRFETVTGHKILERYGMTETNMNSSNPYDGERRAGTVGFPLPGIDIKIIDLDNGHELSHSHIGMIKIKGDNVFDGYWEMAEATNESFTRDGYFLTGDLGEFSQDGYLTIVGRNKDLIISGGLNIYPKEIELLIDSILGVKESAVIGIENKDLGETVVAVIVLDRLELTENDILLDLKNKLANYKMPRKIIFIPELPRNTMGKVQKQSLRKVFSDIFI